VALHWALQALGLTLALSGVYAIYQNKEEGGKPHWSTYHGLSGIVTILVLTIQALGGNLANYSSQLYRLFPHKALRPAFLKWGHRSSGAVSLTLTFVTVYLALFSFWFNAVTPSVLIWWAIAASLTYPIVYTLKSTYL
jgi:cytochrome b-561 domain-containing protein 2